MKRVIVGFLMVALGTIVLIACSEEEHLSYKSVLETTEPVELTEQELIISNFNLENFDASSGIEKNNLEILWGQPKKKVFNDSEWLEYKILEIVKPDLEKGEITDVSYSLLVTVVESIPHYWLVRMDSHNGDAQQSYFDLEKNVFTGMIYFYELTGEISMARYYQKGNGFHGITKAGIPIELPTPSAARCDFKVTSSNCSGTSDCGLLQGNGGGSCGSGGGRGGYRRVRIRGAITDWYNDRNGDGRGQPSEYFNTTQARDRYEWVWVSGGNIGYGSQRQENYRGIRNDGSVRSIPKPKAKPLRIFNNLSGKAKCVYEKLQSKNGNLFKGTIGKFVKDPKYNLVLQLGNCKSSNTACTNGTEVSTTGNVYITIEDNSLTDLDMASTLLHEGIHAELWRYVAQYKRGINPNNKKEVFGYYKHYAEHYGDVFDNNQNNAKNSIDHIYMTQYYIVPIASALRQLDNNKYPLEYYKSYAWDGLRAFDPNNTLGVKENINYNSYRKIVDANSKICK